MNCSVTLNLHLENITTKNKDIIYSPSCKLAIRKVKNLLKNKGRVLVRKSGTESKIRIMVESDDKKLALDCVKRIKKTVLNQKL